MVEARARDAHPGTDVRVEDASGAVSLRAKLHGKIETASATQYSEATVTVDNLMSKSHTVFQMRTRDRKGLLYDVLRASKDLKVHISYAKVNLRPGACARWISSPRGALTCRSSVTCASGTKKTSSVR